MVMTNHGRVGQAMDLLRADLPPSAEQETQAGAKAGTARMNAVRSFGDDSIVRNKPTPLVESRIRITRPAGGGEPSANEQAELPSLDA